MKKLFVTPEDRARVVYAYVSGETTASLGALYACAPVTISNLLKAEGVARRPAGRRLEGKSSIAGGYRRIYAPRHRRADRHGYVFEPIVVWETTHGSTPDGWHIHHKNGDKLDNHILNLEALPASSHISLSRREQLTSGNESDPRVRLAKIGLSYFGSLFPTAVSISATHWYAEHDFLLDGAPVEVKTSRPYRGRCHFDTTNRKAKYHFLVVLNAASKIQKAFLLETSILPSSVWLGGSRGSRYESLALKTFQPTSDHVVASEV